jgi:hypothetical protein
MVRNVVDLRRAIDLLLDRDDVDPKRIALVGYSLGAQAAALTAGVEDRLAGVILQAPPSHLDGADSSYDTIRYIRHAEPARIYFQGATYDEGVPARGLQALIAAAPGTPDAELPVLIAEMQKALSSLPVGLRVKRKAQAAVGELQARFKAFEKSSKQSSAGTVNVSSVAGELLSTATPFGRGKLIVAEVMADGEQLLGIVDSIKKQLPSYAVLLGAPADGKVSFVAAVSDDFIKQGLKAGDWVKAAAQVTGGGGGGRPNLAQAGGKDPAKLADAMEKAKTFAAAALK